MAVSTVQLELCALKNLQQHVSKTTVNATAAQFANADQNWYLNDLNRRIVANRMAYVPMKLKTNVHLSNAAMEGMIMQRGVQSIVRLAIVSTISRLYRRDVAMSMLLLDCAQMRLKMSDIGHDVAIVGLVGCPILTQALTATTTNHCQPNAQPNKPL